MNSVEAARRDVQRGKHPHPLWELGGAPGWAQGGPSQGPGEQKEATKQNKTRGKKRKNRENKQKRAKHSFVLSFWFFTKNVFLIFILYIFYIHVDSCIQQENAKN